MKEMHYPRPTCEECGRIELSEIEIFVWNFIQKFYYALVNTTQVGFSINTQFVEKAVEEYEIDSEFEFLERIITVVKEIMKGQKREDSDE